MPPPYRVWVDRSFALLAGLIAAWLAWSLWVVNVEFDDGYATIVNSQYFLGLSADYLFSRAPMLAWMLMPAEWVANALGLDPLDVRPHHLLMALVHFGYVLGVWQLLRRRFGATPSTLLAFAAAIPTTVFFCYAAFISSDLFPGLVALGMLWLADRHAAQPRLETWLALVLLGAFVALVKHMYGAIWLAILLAHAGLVLVEGRRAWRPLAQLCLAGALSGLIFWLAYGLVLKSSFPDVPWLLRPLHQMQTVVAAFQVEGPITEIIYQWVYLRNLSIYGMLAMTLVLPGIVLAWRKGDRLQRSIAIAWLVLFAVMQAVSFKEARYLAYLAPLSAFLIAPVIAELARRNWMYLLPLGALLLVDLGFSVREAARLRAPFYRNQVSEFLGILPAPKALHGRIVMTRYLSFVTPDKYAFFGDRYHRIINLNSDQIRLLYGYPRAKVLAFADTRGPSTADFGPGDILVYANDVAARVPPLHPVNSTTLQPDFVQFVAVAETLNLHRVGDEYRSGAISRQPLLLLHARGVDAEPLTSFDRFPAAATAALLGLSATPDQLQTIAFRIHTWCDLSGCRRS